MKVQGYNQGLVLFFCVLLVLAFQRIGAAATVNVQVSGVLNFHSANTPTGYWDGTVANGTPYTFSLQFNSLTPDTDSDPTIGTYDSSGIPFQCTIAFGDYTFTTTGTTVTIWNDFLNGASTQDGIFFSNLNGFTQNGLSLTQNGIQTNFFFNNTSFLSSDSLSQVQTYPLPDFSQTYMVVSGSFNNGNGLQTATVQGTVDSFAVTAVPEPSIAALIVAGSTVCIVAQRLRRRRR